MHSVSLRKFCRLFLETLQCFVHDFLSFADDRIQVGLILEALRINLVNVLGARWPGCKPTVVGYNLKAADRRAVTRGASQFISDRLTRKVRSGNCFRRQFFETRLLLRRRWRVDTRV